MEWVLLTLFAGIAALVVSFPRRPRLDVAGADAIRPDADVDAEELREERRLLLAELRELDDDAATGRISATDRLTGRRALAPRLRAAHEALRALGNEADVPA